MGGSLEERGTGIYTGDYWVAVTNSVVSDKRDWVYIGDKTIGNDHFPGRSYMLDHYKTYPTWGDSANEDWQKAICYTLSNKDLTEEETKDSGDT